MKTEKNKRFFESQSSGGIFRKILFIILVLSLLIVSGCASETSDTTEDDSGDLGYVEDIDAELDTSDLDSLDEDLNLGWI